MASELKTGQSLRNQTLTSPNKRFTLWMQPDGNLVLYDGPLTPQTAYWDTGTGRLPAPYRPTHADLQKDGNFVLSNDAMNPAWASDVWDAQYTSAKLVLQDDGNLVIHLPNGTPFWATNTVLSAHLPSHGVSPTPSVASAAPGETEVGWGKKMETTATLYRNGTLTVDCYQNNDNWFGGLRGRISCCASMRRATASGYPTSSNARPAAQSLTFLVRLTAGRVSSTTSPRPLANTQQTWLFCRPTTRITSICGVRSSMRSSRSAQLSKKLRTNGVD